MMMMPNLHHRRFYLEGMKCCRVDVENYYINAVIWSGKICLNVQLHLFATADGNVHMHTYHTCGLLHVHLMCLNM